MAQTRPRFGGGRIMETQDTKTVSLSKDFERENHNRSIMEANHTFRSCEPKVLSKGKQDADEKKTATKALLGHKEKDSIRSTSNNSQCESQKHSKRELTSAKSRRESLPNEHGCEEGLCAYNRNSAPSLLPLRSQNDPESMKQDFEKKEYVPEESPGYGYKADVKQLMSVLRSLGIHVEIKPYVRSASTSTEERNSDEDDRMAERRITRQSRRIDLNTSELAKRPEKKSSKDDKEPHEYNFLYCKNLFLKDRSDNYYLIIAEESATVDFKVLKKQLNAARNLSFADVTATESILGERSGGLNPFVAMRTSAHEVRFALHQSLLAAKSSRTPLAFHPLDHSLQVEITVHELIAFLEYFDKQLEILPADLNSSGTSECMSSNSNQNMEVKGASKQSKIEAKNVSKDDGDSSQALKLNEDNGLLNPTINGKPLWKMHMRKGKLKSFLKATTTNDNTVMCDNNTNQAHAAVEEFNEKEPEMPGEAITTNASRQKCQEEQSRLVYTISKPQAQHEEYSKESKFLIDEIEQPNRHLDSSETVSSSTLPEITEFYNNLSGLSVDFQDLHMGMSTTRDIGPSIGCKCFFLKDRRQNYYLIIAHEYYELDHGRLKKALKPKKKLDHAEPADILENLGVQPSRISPFSCTTDRAIAKNVMVFMTEKVRPSEVILCIQHPFAEGRRLVMKSGELQRYLSSFRSPIGEVEEKTWPERFNRIFTRFTDQSYKQAFDSHAETGACEQQQITTADSLGLTSEFEQLTECHGKSEGNESSSKAERYRASSVSLPKRALSEMCKIVGKALLIHAIIDNHLMSSSRVETVGVHGNGETSQGSSVDPPAKDAQKEGHDICLSQKEHLMARSEAEKIVHATETTENVNHGKQDSDRTECELIRHCHNPSQERHSEMDGTSLTVEDILRYLRDIAVDFTFTDSSDTGYIGDGLDERLQHRGRNKSLYESTPHSRENPKQMKADDVDLDLPGEMPSDKFHDDEKKGDDDDNVENCSTAYMLDKNTHYIIVGGESDYLTKRRFRRLFHLPGQLRMGDANTPGLTTTPFSLALMLKEGTNEKHPPPNIYVIMFTSVYLDPETKCVFHIDQKGSTLMMTSSQFEYFITKSGMECWYIP